MSEIQLTPSKALPTPYELGAMSTQHLREKLAQSLTMTAQHLHLLSLIWAELEKRGENLDDLRTGLAVYMPQIAAGRLDANAVIRFAGQPTVLKSLAMLPIDEQAQLASGKVIDVLTVNAEGQYDNTPMPAYALTAAQARMIFNGDKILSVQEQRAKLEAARVSKKMRVKAGTCRVRYDAGADVVRVGNTSATVGEITAALSEAATRQTLTQTDVIEVQEMIPMTLRFSRTERTQLKIRAAEAGMSQEDYVRKMLALVALL